MAKNAALRAQGRQDEVIGRAKAQREAKRENWRHSIIQLAEASLPGSGSLMDRIEMLRTKERNERQRMREEHEKAMAEAHADSVAQAREKAELVTAHAEKVDALVAQIDALKRLLDGRSKMVDLLHAGNDELRKLAQQRGETIQRLETKLANGGA